MDANESNPEPLPAEVRARALAEQHDHEGAATELVTAFGPEVLGWLQAVAPSDAIADDAFGLLCERLWQALPTFEWTGSIRTWMYVVARNLLRDQHRRGKRRPEVPLSGVAEVAEAVRSSTAAFKKTAQKDRLARLREQLQPDERMLLSLRLDRGLSWRDIARVLHDGGEHTPPDEAELGRAAARARQQFRRIKDRLRRVWDASP